MTQIKGQWELIREIGTMSSMRETRLSYFGIYKAVTTLEVIWWDWISSWQLRMKLTVRWIRPC